MKQSDISKIMAEIGRKGGKSKSEKKIKAIMKNLPPLEKRLEQLKKGRETVKNKLTPEQRRERAQRAVQVRWAKYRKSKEG